MDIWAARRARYRVMHDWVMHVGGVRPELVGLGGRKFAGG
jgi:hypothetical protein